MTKELTVTVVEIDDAEICRLAKLGPEYRHYRNLGFSPEAAAVLSDLHRIDAELASLNASFADTIDPKFQHPKE